MNNYVYNHAFLVAISDEDFSFYARVDHTVIAHFEWSVARCEADVTLRSNRTLPTHDASSELSLYQKGVISRIMTIYSRHYHHNSVGHNHKLYLRKRGDYSEGVIILGSP